jgi:serine/threonine-protein kinase
MLEIGQVFHDKYRVDRLVGKGGMGQVFEGYHLLIGRRVAIKVLLPEVASSENATSRFEREVRATARISNDHILDVFDAGSLPDGSRFMVSEFLDGETLEARLGRRPLSAKETAVLMIELLDGLAAAHRAGIAHRDLKPDNIFLSRKANRVDFVKIIDFGVSKFQSDDEHAMSMTTTGTVLGTPHYLSPEQAQGEKTIDQRSDLYTVGVIMYRCICGRVPFDAATFQAQLFKIALEDPRPLDEVVPGFDRRFAALTQKAMAKDRAARFQSADEMSRALAAWLEGAPPAADAVADTVQVEPTAATMATPSAPRRRGRPAWLVFGVAALAVLGAAAFWAARQAQAPGIAADSAAQPASAAPSTTASTAPRSPELTLPPEPPTAAGGPSMTAIAPEPATSERNEQAERAAPVPTTASPPLANSPRPSHQAAQKRLHASKPQPSSGVVEPPAPKPTATAHPRRDFGY